MHMHIMKTFHITYHGFLYSRYEYIAQYDITYIIYMQIIMKRQGGYNNEMHVANMYIS